MHLILGMDEVLIHVRFMIMVIDDVETDDDDDADDVVDDDDPLECA